MATFDGTFWLRWLAIPVGLAFGALYAWSFGRLAYRRLAARGPELLQLTIHGVTATADPQRPAFDRVLKSMPAGQRTLFYLCGFAGVIALFPQGVVPVIFKSTGTTEKVWFLAMYMPEPWQWPMAIFMVTLGLVLLAFTARIFIAARAASRSPAAAQRRTPPRRISPHRAGSESWPRREAVAGPITLIWPGTVAGAAKA